jgi:hypothetical protein
LNEGGGGEGQIGLGVAGGGNGGKNNASNALLILPTSGLANSGSGGGGCANRSVAYPSGAGGSGIVILRYPSYLAPATSTTGSPKMVVTGGWRVYTFVASGTITF